MHLLFHLLLHLLLHLPTQPLVPLLPLRQLLLRQLLAPTISRPTSIVVALHALLTLWVRATSALAMTSATRTRRHHHRPQCQLRSRLLYPRNRRLHHQWMHRRPSTRPTCNCTDDSSVFRTHSCATAPTAAPTAAPRPQRVIFIPIRCSHGYSHCCVPTTGPNEAPTAAPTAVPTSAPTCTTATVPTCKGGWAYSFSAHSCGAVTSDRSTYCDSYLHADIHAYFWSYRSSYQCTDGRPIPSRPPLLLQHRLPLRLRCPHGYVVCHIH